MAPARPLSATESMFEYVVRFIAALKEREEQLGAYVGDGPTMAQADDLVEKIRPIYEGPSYGGYPEMLDAFYAAVNFKTSWLFPEKDPLAESLIWACGLIENVIEPLSKITPREGLDEYRKLALVGQMARRAVVLQEQSKAQSRSTGWRYRANRIAGRLGFGRAFSSK